MKQMMKVIHRSPWQAVALVILGLFPALLLEPITAAVIDSLGLP